MDVNKMISEFQSINDKLVTYENERTDLQIFIKNMLKENQKLDDKIKKESDTLLKEYYRIKIITNNFYINKLKTIFHFEMNNKRDSKNEKV